MNTEIIKKDIEVLKDNVLSVMNDMIELKRGKYGDNLPAFDINFETANNLLLKTEFNLVISGEVNRGKSTFINAIIGSDILPTYDKETTSQVFKISNSKQESFFIVFDNGDTQTITKEELKQFGSQVETNNNGSNDLGDKRIAYIQVNTPIEFLPEGVTIVDTPGIGSTYKQHSEITKGFMQYADSIIYLCSAKKPIEMTDINFIKDNVLSLNHVPSIMFVMSKADEANNEEALKEQIRRSQILLKDNFESNILINKSIFPISSLLLIKANNTTNDWKQIYYDNSCFEKIKLEIEFSIIKTRGLAWTINGFNECIKYYNKGSNALSQHIEMFNKTLSSQKTALESIQTNRARFISEMGTVRQKEILIEITNILNAIKPNMRMECSNDGEIYQKYINKIDDEITIETSQEDIDKYINKLQEDIVTDIVSKWENMCKAANYNASELLQEFGSNCNEFIEQSYSIGMLNKNETTITITPSNKEYFTSIRGQFGNAMMLGTATYVALQIAGVIITGGISLFITTGLLVYGAIFGRKEAKSRAFDRTKQELKNYVRNVIHGAEIQLFEVSVLDGKYHSTVDAFAKSMLQFSNNMISETYERCEKELIENEKKIKEVISGTDPSLKTVLVNLQKVWKEKGDKLKMLAEKLNELNHIMFA